MARRRALQYLGPETGDVPGIDYLERVRSALPGLRPAGIELFHDSADLWFARFRLSALRLRFSGLDRGFHAVPQDGHGRGLVLGGLRRGPANAGLSGSEHRYSADWRIADLLAVLRPGGHRWCDWSGRDARSSWHAPTGTGRRASAGVDGQEHHHHVDPS